MPWMLWVLALCGGLFVHAFPGAAQEPLLVAAASSLEGAMTEIGKAFTAQTGIAVQFHFGASGTIRRQIEQGAPYTVFFSADEEQVEALHAQGLTGDAGRNYAKGALALVISPQSSVVLDPNLDGFAAALRQGTIRHVAIANPEHAPYGMRARDVLEHLGIWQQAASRLVLGENTAHALQFVLAGGADAGLVPLSLVMDAGLSASSFVVVPESWHRPLWQRAVVLRGAPPEAQAFYAFCFTAAAQAFLQRHGFFPPQGGW